MTAPLQNPDLSSQILVELGKINVHLAVIQETMKAIPDHEARIRKLEAWRYGLPIAGLVAIGSASLSIYELLHK